MFALDGPNGFPLKSRRLGRSGNAGIYPGEKGKQKRPKVPVAGTMCFEALGMASGEATGLREIGRSYGTWAVGLVFGPEVKTSG